MNHHQNNLGMKAEVRKQRGGEEIGWREDTILSFCLYTKQKQSVKVEGEGWSISLWKHLPVYTVSSLFSICAGRPVTLMYLINSCKSTPSIFSRESTPCELLWKHAYYTFRGGWNEGGNQTCKTHWLSNPCSCISEILCARGTGLSFSINDYFQHPPLHDDTP